MTKEDNKQQAPPEGLSDKLRKKAQRSALFYNLFGQTINFIVVGQYLQLYASDVLGFEPARIAAVIGVIPLVSFLRFFVLDWVRKFGRGRLLAVTAIARMVVLVVMILIPPAWMTFGLLLGLLLVFTVAQQFGAGTVWGSLMRDITIDSDRGQFFSRMRFSFTAVNAITLFIFSLVITNEMTDLAYKALLVVAAVGQLNTLFWAFKIPDQTESESTGGGKSLGGYKRFIITLRTSPLLRLPLVISILMQLAALPMMAVYLRTMLGVPAQLVSFFLLSSTIGSAISFLIWGKIADTLGFRPMLSGLLVLSIAVAPCYLILAPFDPTRAFSLLAMNLPEAVTALTLLLLGFINGALASGMGIAMTTVEQHHVRRRDALESLNIYGVIVGLVAAGVILFSGVYLQSFALPRGIRDFGNGIFHFDWVKAWFVLVVPLFQFAIIVLVRRLPNTHPNFEMDDFFGTLRNNPVRTLFAQRRLYSEDESRRMSLARWLGQSDNPLSINSLIEMTTDPSYDVKTEAIRSLGLSGSKAAGAALLEILKDPDRLHLADHVAWALGELKYQPAVPSIRKGLSPEFPNRIRAMAARALGRIGDPGAIPDLIATFEDPDTSLHIKSSCMRALVALNARDYAREIFVGVDQLGTRNERFELVAACGEWMHTPIEWVLRANAKTTLTEAIAIQAEEMPDAWLRIRGDLLESLVSHDRNALIRAFDAEIPFRPEQDQDLFKALATVIRQSEKWTATSALAAAIVIFAPVRKTS